ncbi:MAG: hypothetical protein HUJ75_07850, partial [Parasporobacterium sp.]|nr:hypothetical protein [Parasporobacterium sp.]
QDLKLTVDFDDLDSALFKVKVREDIGKRETGAGVGIGAGVAIVYTDLKNEAQIKDNVKIETGTFWLDVDGGIEATTIAVSGSDPLASHEEYYNEGQPTVGEGDYKNTSVDASLAFAVLNGSVRAEIAKTAQIKATGKDTVDVCKTILKLTGDAEKDAANKAKVADLVNFAVTSRIWSDTESRASSFSTGSTTAVGACVAVGVTELDGSVKVDGKLTSEQGTMRISVTSTSRDKVRGIASAMGTDMDRLFQKFRKAGETSEQYAERVSNGHALDDVPVKKSTDTSKKTTQTLQANQAAGGQNDPNAPVGMNVLAGQNAQGNNDPAVAQGNNLANNAGAQNNPAGTNKKNNYQVAAAVAFNVTKHNNNIDISGTLNFHILDSFIKNNENFATFATGAAMSLAKNSNAIAAAAAIGINNNTSVVTVKKGTLLKGSEQKKSVIKYDADGKEQTDTNGDIIYVDITEYGNVNIKSVTQTNLSDEFSRYLAAQSIAGAVSGSGGSKTIAGALSIVTSKSRTEVVLEDAANGLKVTIDTNGAVDILAQSKARLTARAGALSVSKGTSTGAGASFATVYAYDTVKAIIGSGSSIKASDLAVNALKIAVTNDDYVSPGWSVLLSDSSDLTDEQKKENKDKLGIVDMSKKSDGSYDFKINMDSAQMQDLLTLLPVSQVNYYVEAISGAATTGNADKLLAGSFAFLFAETDIQSVIRDNCVIDLNVLTGKLAIKASDDSRSRVIAGAASAGPSKTGGGLTAAILVDTRKVLAQLGSADLTDSTKATTVNAASVEVLAETNADDFVITFTAAVAKDNALGGAITVEVNRSETTAVVGNYVTINKDKTLDKLGLGCLHVAANGGRNSLVLSASASVAYSGTGTGVGATLAGIYNKAVYLAKVGESVKANINGTATIENVIKNAIISLMAAVTVAGDSGAAVNVSLLWDGLDAKVSIGNNTEIKAGRDITVRTNADSRVINALLSFAASGTGAAGVTLYYNELHRKAVVSIGDNVKLTSTSVTYKDKDGSTKTDIGNILVESTGKEWSLIIGAAFAAGKGATVAGNNGYTNAKSEYRVETGNDCVFTADDSVAFYAHLDQSDYIIVGVLSVGTGSASLGEIVSVLTMMNKVEATTGTGVKMTALVLGDGVQTVNRSDRRKGVYIGATATEKLLSVAVNLAGSASMSMSGTVNVIYESNIIKAVVGDNSELRAGYNAGTTDINPNSGDGDVVVEADDDSHLLVIDGSVSASGNIAIGGAIVVLVFEKEVLADNRAYRILSKRDVTVTAGADDQLILVVFGVAGSGSAAVAANASTLKYTNNIQALLGRLNPTADADGKGKTHITAGRNLSVTVNASETLVNAGAQIAGSGTAAVGGLIVITLYRQTARAIIRQGVIAFNSNGAGIGGNLNVTAITKETISSDGLGIQGSGTAAVGGLLDVVTTNNKVEASIGNEGPGATIIPCVINVKGDALIQAIDEFDLLVIAAVISGAGVAGVGVTAVFSIHYNELSTIIGAGTELTAANVRMEAQGKRNYKVFSAAATGAGTAAVGVSVAVLLVGCKMSEDENNQAFRQTGSIQPDKVVKGVTDKLDNDKSAGGIGLKTNEDADFDANGNFNPTKTSVNAAADFNENLNPADSNSILGSDGTTSNDLGGSLAESKSANEGTTSLMTDQNKLKKGDLSEVDANVDNIKLNPTPVTTLTYKDATSSVVEGKAKITANGPGNNNGNIYIYAGDSLSSVLLSGSVGGAGVAGVGVGLSVAKLYSNAAATVVDGAVLKANGTISVIAEDGKLNSATAADKFFDSADADRFDGLNGTIEQNGTTPEAIANKTFGEGKSSAGSKDASNNVKDQLKNTGMESTPASNWIIGISASAGGIAGVAVAGGVFLYWTTSTAKMLGKVENAQNLTVAANMNRGTVHPIIVAIGGGGTAGVGIGVAVAITNGKAEAFIGEGAIIEQVTGNINVSAGGDDNAITAVGATVGLGFAGGAANVAVANNHDTVKAYIAKGAHIGSDTKYISGNINVIAEMQSAVNAILVSVAAGAGALGATVLVTLNDITTEAFIGEEVTKADAAGGTGSGAIYTNGNIIVKSTQTADT